MYRSCFPGPNPARNVGESVTMTVRPGDCHCPPAGDTSAWVGIPFVNAKLFFADSLINVSTQRFGKSPVNVNVTTSGGGVDAVTKGKIWSGGVTTGGIASASSGDSGGADCPGGIGAAVLLSRTW